MNTSISTSKTNNAWQRIGLLLGMEWAAQKRNILLLSGIMLLVSITLTELILAKGGSREGGFALLIFFTGLFFFALSTFVFWMGHKRFNHSDTITYTQVPASSAEKFTTLLIEYALVVPWTLILALLYFAIEFLLHPYLRETWTVISEIHWQISDDLDGGIYLRNVMLIVQLTSIAVTIGIAALVTMRFRNFVPALFAYIGISTLVGVGSSSIWITRMLRGLNELSRHSNVSEEQVKEIFLLDIPWEGMIIFYSSVSIAFLAFGYYSLKKRQLI